MKIFLLIVLMLGLIGCMRERMPWQLDLQYSRYLTVMASEYEKMSGTKSANTVDALRIYKITDKGYKWYNLKELFTKNLVFETKDKQFIRNFVLTAQEDVRDLNSCNRVYRNLEFDQFYVVMFDNTFMRTGYFLFTVCHSRGKEYGEILVPDESGFGPIGYYNESLISILKTININLEK